MRVAAVAPGFTETDMVSAMKPEALSEVISRVPLGRLGFREEIAAAVEFCVTNDFVTGRTIEVDGGVRV